MRIRVIPVLLLRDAGLVKTVKFKNPRYLGDPINIIKIFNDKGVDELVLLDITTTVRGIKPNLGMISDLASECFMPLCYGGGISDSGTVRELFKLGIEKVAVNSFAVNNQEFIREMSDVFGSQSVVVSIDVKKNFLGKYEVFTHSGTNRTGMDPVTLARQVEDAGAGEIMINSIDRDGTMSGYDLVLVRKVASAVSIPVIACGGAGKVQDLVDAVNQGNASAVAAGSFFVFHGPHRAVLINVPSEQELELAFGDEGDQ